MRHFYRFIPFLLVLLTFSMAADAVQWQTTEFQVFPGVPNLDKNRPSLERRDFAILLGTGVSEEAIGELEAYLHEVATAFQRDGFADPVAGGTLEPVIDLPDGRKAIRVYLFDITTDLGIDKLGFKSGECDTPPRRPKLMLNSRYVVSGNKITDSGYQNAAHELFHAVQYASTFKRVPAPCRGGSWITEGTADAVGFDYARRLRNIKSDYWDTMAAGPRFFKAWGGRAHYIPLSKGRENSWNYHTSAFWRDLAELTYAKKNNKRHPSAVLAPTDYTYLASLFSNRPPGTSAYHELQWLDSWIKSYPSIMRDLAPVYAQFVSSAADHMWRRIPEIVGLSGGERQERWLRYLFQECEKVTLSPGHPVMEQKFEIDFASARCVSVRISGAARSNELVIQETGMTEAEQKQLWIGAIGGNIVGQADIRKDNTGTSNAIKTFAWWRIPVVPEDENFFIISNIARKVQGTAAINPTLHFSLPRWQSDMSAEQAMAASTSSGKQPKTSKEVADRQKALRLHPTTSSAAAATAGHGPNIVDPSCKPARKARNQCGPQLTILLSQDYGGVPDPALLGGAGGMLAQIGGVTGDDGTGLDDLEFMELMQQTAMSHKGKYISIGVPLIHYGFKGGFSNAQISVANTKDGVLEALETSPSPDGDHAPNGSLSITEYTPNVLRGTFNAQLVDPRKVIQTPNGSVLTIEDSVAGSFTISAPWRGNAAPSVDPDSAMMAGLRDDMIEIIQMMPEETRSSAFIGSNAAKLCEMGFESQQLSSLGIDASCSGGLSAPGYALEGQCDCDCEYFEAERSIRQCRRQCKPEWIENQCYGSAISDAGPQDAETQRFEADLRQHNDSGLIKAQENAIVPVVFLFQTSSAELRAKMWAELEESKQAAADYQREQALKALEPPSAREAEYDVETLRYKEAVKALGLPPEAVEDLVEMFYSNEAAFRETLWQRVRESPLNQQ